MEEIFSVHQEEYGVAPDVVAKAPGRFHLIGEHSWFFKDKTLSMAVNLPVYICASKRKDSSVRVFFAQMNDRKRANLTSLKFKKEDKWANAVKAIFYGFASGGFEIGGTDITIYSEILPSAGFGITSAIKAASAICLKQLYAPNMSMPEVLQVIERGNRLFLQQENYNSDNNAALFSRKGSFIITDHHKNSYAHIDIPFENKKILLVDLRVPRISLWNEESLFEPENALILGDMKETKAGSFGGWQYINNVTDINEELSVVSEDTRRKLLCVMREHGDVLEAVKSLEKNDFSRFARTINHSYESLRDYYDLSCPEIDWILKRVIEIEPNLENIREPVSCGRITGKGFGRCIYTLLRESDVDKFKQKLSEYEHIFGFHPSCYEVTSSDGASIVKA
ncbi:MAG: galactokinase [Treponema sp.]|nr:galactokinase [Treponema sp.]